METTAKCVSMGPAYCRERLQNPVRFSSASIQRGEFHFGGPRAGSGNGTGGKYLLRKEAIEVVSLHERESGFYSRYFVVPKKDGGLRPILDLRQLNRSVSRLKFKMLTLKQVASQIRSEDWFVAIDLKKHTSMSPSFPLTGSS